MVDMQNSTDVGSGAGAGAGTAGESTLDTEDDTIPGGSTECDQSRDSLHRAEQFSRRRVRRIHVPRTLMRRICTCYRQNVFLD